MTAPAIAFPDAAGEAAWRAAVARVLKGEDADARLVGRTLDGIPVMPLYPAAAAPPAPRPRRPARAGPVPSRRVSTPTTCRRSTRWRTAPTASS